MNEGGNLSCGQRLKKYHSVLEIFGNYSCFVPRTLAACLVYARFNILFIIAGRFFINGVSTGAALGGIVGCSVAFGLLHRCIYFMYGGSAGSAVRAKKECNTTGMFCASLMKLVLLAATYLYMAIGIYFSFDNASYIPHTKEIAASFVAGLLIDIVVIDTVYAMITSLFGKSDVRLPSEDVSPTN